MTLSVLEERLHYRFTKPEHLVQAMTHRSYSSVHNERLEFLGDSVLNCVIAQLLYQQFPRLDEGELSRVRANVVRQQSLADVALRLGLGEFLKLGEGEMKSGGFRRPSILADALEAIFGAVFIDAGFERAQDVIASCFQGQLAELASVASDKDHKTQLQEFLQGKRLPLPVYTVIETRGAAHNQDFDVECVIDSFNVVVHGSGKSRRAAEQAAAEQALKSIMTIPSSRKRAKRPPAQG
jgi:ribonuclease III